MVVASVGHQCPECVAEGNAAVRQARTRYGGAIVTSSPGLVTRVLIGVNVAIFLIQQLVGVNEVARDFGSGPAFVANGEYYRLITAGFLHSGVMHLAFNMLALWIFGRELEALFGRSRFLLVYGLSLLGGSVASLALSDILTLSVGASGAIFGLFGAYIVVAVKQKLDLRPFAVLIGINLVIGFIPGFNIDWRAHLGGLVIGAVVSAAIVFPAPPRRALVLGLTVAGVVLGLVTVTAWRVAQLQDQVEVLRLVGFL
jgi:membrane associated rhomboid family serine protease